MRTLMLCLLVVSPALSQVFSIGVKGGVPLTDAFKTAQSGSTSYLSDTKRYTVGPAVEFHLPFGFGIELDALYKRLNYSSSASAASSSTTANTWEFPLQLKHRFGAGPVKPYLAAGASFRHVSGIKQVTNFFTSSPSTSTDHPAEFDNRFTAGFVASGGIEFGSGHFRVAPEVRYTRWGWDNFRSLDSLLKSNADQTEFLIGITF